MRLHQTKTFAFLIAIFAGCSQHSQSDSNSKVRDSATARLDVPSQNSISEIASEAETVIAAHEANTDRADAEMEACLIVLESELSQARSDELKFVAIGRDENGWIDPTDAVMKRLTEGGLFLRPASKARLPKSGEMETGRRYRGIIDPTTGKRAYIYYASVDKWIDDNTVEVSYGNYGGPLAGGGGTVVVERKEGKWSIKEHTSFWVS